MFSGSNPSADLYWANALAQAQSQNNSLDWALLAQQWISHQQNINSTFDTNNRINTDFVSPADAPPAPKIGIKNTEEQGEADMDVEDDQSEPENQNFVPPPLPPNLWSMSSPAPLHLPVMTQQIPPSSISAPWNMWNTPGILNTNLPPPSLHIPEINTPLVVNDKINKSSIIPSLMDTPVNAPVDNQFLPTLDAAKRKTLPAWIREGLEKMEREKQKQLEKEKASTIDKNENLENQSLIESLQEAEKSDIIGSSRTHINSSNYKGFLKNSGASSDESDISDNESDAEKARNIKKESSVKINPWHGKTREEIEEEMMLVVRRSLTEILLEITNQEIRNIAQETLKRHKLKASSAQVIRKSALTSISSNLGLGAYDSDSSNDSDTDDEVKKDDKDNDKDSEEELRETMLNKQRAFKAIAREIDILVEKEESRQDEIRQERLRREQLERSSERLLSQGGDNDIIVDHLSGSGTSGNLIGNSSGIGIIGGQLRRTNYERDFGETHHDKKSYSSNGQKRLKERTSRFSDNKESKNKSSSSAAGYLLPTSTNSLNTPNLTNSTIPTTTKLLQQSVLATSSAQILSNSAAAQSFLMANAVLSEALLKNDKKFSSSSSKRSKRNRKSRSRSRSRNSNSSTSSSSNSDDKSSQSSKSSRTVTSSNSSNSSKSSDNKKSNTKNKRSKSKSKDPSNEFDEKSEQFRHRQTNNRDDDNRVDSVEYNQSRSHHYHYNKSSNRRSHSSDEDRSSTRDDERSSSHNYYDSKYNSKRNDKKDRYKDRDDDNRKQRRRYDNSPDSDDYYRSRRYHTNSSSSRSSSHRNDKKDYYSKTDTRKRSYSHREESRSRSRSKSYSSRDKHYDKY